jgi:hypothetical protein
MRTSARIRHSSIALCTATILFSLAVRVRAQETPPAEVVPPTDPAETTDGGSAADAAATAEPAEEESPSYREALERFEGAQQLFESGDYRAALAEFQRIYELLDGHPRRYFVLFNLGRSYEELHRYDRAIELYRRYLDEGGAAAEDRADVEASLRALERLLGSVAITLRGAERAEVWLEDWQIGDAPGEIRIPGGQHVLEIRAPGFEVVRREIEVAARARIEVEVEMLALSDFRGVSPALFVTSSALAVVAVAIGAGLGGTALSLHDDAVQCADRPGCVLDPMQRRREISDLALGADVTFGIAGLFAITSVVLLFVTDWGGAPAAGGAAEERVSLVPWLDPAGAGVFVRARL